VISTFVSNSQSSAVVNSVKSNTGNKASQNVGYGSGVGETVTGTAAIQATSGPSHSTSSSSESVITEQTSVPQTSDGIILSNSVLSLVASLLGLFALL
jgi:lysozyme family protein